MSVRWPISVLSQPQPKKSLSVPNTLAAKTLLVPSPDPAGMAESSVISMPPPKSLSWSPSEANRSSQKSGRKPQSASAALGMEKALPTWLKSASCS